MARSLLGLLLGGTFLVLVGCLGLREPRLLPSTTPLAFDEVGREAGLSRYRWRGLRREAKILTSIGGSVAWGDFDGDGDPDLFFSQGVLHPDRPRFPEDCGRLLRNEGGRIFEDVTAPSGIRSCGWGMGILWEDLNDDGNLDLYLTRAGPNQLWLGGEEGLFHPPADPAGASGPSDHWSTGVAALDADGDRDLDLYVAGYLATTYDRERRLPTFELRLLHEYEAAPDLLLINQGEGRFRPAEGGISGASPKRGLTVVAADLDGEAGDDVFVANDRDRNTLLHNRRDGILEDRTVWSGLGLGLAGEEEAGMGADLGDPNRDGRPDLVVTNFGGEPANLYLNLGDGLFQDRSRDWRLFEPTFEWLGWATGVVDLDLDGRLDLFVSNGHLTPGWIAGIILFLDDRPGVESFLRGSYRQPPLLFHGGPEGFEPDRSLSGLRGVWRGAAAGDYDLDGRPDLVFYSSDHRTPTLLLHNRSSDRKNHWLQVASGPAGTFRNLELGRAVATASEGALLTAFGSSGGGYLAASSLPLQIGLGPRERVDLRLEMANRTLRFVGLPTDRRVVVPRRSAPPESR
ncbi:MAG: VCBS repeat-containing protein [Thermoanaerobaculia bacterium]|nr:VCBS repeat-containing protein [Thermoanaerobaculia bacterium]